MIEISAFSDGFQIPFALRSTKATFTVPHPNPSPEGEGRALKILYSLKAFYLILNFHFCFIIFEKCEN
jgi:hypothetical protein